MRSTVALCSLLALTPTAHGAEWFVSTSGSDASGNGSISQPFRSVSHVVDPANDIVQAGDIITLRGPTNNNVYNETEVRLRVPLTLRSHPGEWAHIACPINVADTVCIQIDPDASGSRISRLEVSGGNLYAVFLQTDWYRPDGTSGTGASNIIIEDSKLHGSGRDVIKITPKCNHVTIRRNEIYASGAIYPPGTPPEDKNAEGIDNVNGSNMLVEDNYIHDTATTGVYFKGGARDVIVQRNRIENAGEAGILIGFDTSPEFFDLTENPQYYEAIRGIVRNNLVRGTNYAGIGLYASRDAVVANNTVIDAARSGHAAIYYGVTLQDFDPDAGRPANTGALVRNNLVIQNARPCMAIRYSQDLGGLSGLSGNPGSDYNAFYDTAGACRYIDLRPGSPLNAGGTLPQWRSALNTDSLSLETPLSVANDGHLPAGSAAIDRGQTLAQVADDIDRQIRTAPYDIGADERSSDAIFANNFQ
ncbi:MAG: right-handed parallel beta-helix repeat-containing protein [Rhodanobacteraceae bacterium]|nr:right-handed parallel beta-helix repeat-containing protein [Rhodanobacteraceae bacterium]